jgi:exodeoxyribonuclease-3
MSSRSAIPPGALATPTVLTAPLTPRARLTLSTWNINSVRLRIDLVTRFLETVQPDVLCLQETKCPDDAFPAKALKKLGYDHLAINGQKGYHGVAVLSRLPFDGISIRGFCGKGDSRHIAVTLGDKAGLRDPVTLHNFYVPAGGDEPDPEINPKFAHKLAFLDEMEACDELRPGAGRAILVGDLNVAPLEHDVWSHKQLLKVVSHTPVECERLTRVQRAGAWVDPMRVFVPEPTKVYTWWSYRSPNWAVADKGRRLDHVWVSPELGDRVSSIAVAREARGWDRPSDHVPVTATLEL